MTAPPPLLVLGYANVDVIARVPRLPGSGERVTAAEVRLVPGGMAANCACAAAFHGSEVVFFGNLGEDPFGNLLLEDFARYGVTTAHAHRAERTTTAVVTVTPEGERAIVSEPCSYHPEPLRAFLESFRGPAGFLYLDGYHLCRALAELERARAAGFRIYCDLDGAPDTDPVADILAALAHVDVVQWNPRIAATLFPWRTPEEATAELLDLVACALLTRGPEPVLLADARGLVTVPVPVPERVTDTTGAGDIFAGTFLHHRNRGAPAEEAVRAAAQTASASTRYRGARLPLP